MLYGIPLFHDYILMKLSLLTKFSNVLSFENLWLYGKIVQKGGLGLLKVENS